MLQRSFSFRSTQRELSCSSCTTGVGKRSLKSVYIHRVSQPETAEAAGALFITSKIMQMQTLSCTRCLVRGERDLACRSDGSNILLPIGLRRGSRSSRVGGCMEGRGMAGQLSGRIRNVTPSNGPARRKTYPSSLTDAAIDRICLPSAREPTDARDILLG